MASVDMFAWSGFIVSMKNIIKPGTQGFMYPDSRFLKQYQQIPVCDPNEEMGGFEFWSFYQSI